jgi:hypothetical protein
MGGRGEELLVGALCLLLALANGWRVWSAHRRGEVPLNRTRLHRAGEVPLYRTRLKRAGMGAGKYAALLAFHAALTAVLLVIAADLLFGLNLRGR